MPPRRTRGRSLAFRLVAAVPVLVAAGALMWFTLAVTLSMVMSRRNPPLAYEWWPFSAEARARVGEAGLQRRPTPAQLSEIENLARAALSREPVSVSAVRALGLAATLRGRSDDARRLFVYSESLSRRDVVTQLWLIESSVSRDDVEGALRHYNRALSTSVAIRETLFPILVQASADRAIAPKVIDLVASRPNWWREFTYHLIASDRSPPTVEALVRRLRLNAAEPAERELLAHAIDRLVQLGAYGRAFALYRGAAGRSFDAASVRNGSFEASGDLPPFDWKLTDEGGLSAFRQVREDGSGENALFMMTSDGPVGEVARQLLLLRPGNFRLTALVGDSPAASAARPIVSVRCAGNDQTALSQTQFPQAQRPTRIELRFAVPRSGCPAQWLSLQAGSSLEHPRPMPWIDSVAIHAL